MNDNNVEIENTDLEDNKRKRYSLTSFILAVIPLIVWFFVFVFCLISSQGKISDNDGGAIWWVMIAMIFVFFPLTIIFDILSLVFGVRGLKGKKTFRSWLGIIFVAIDVLLIFGVFIFLLF